MKFNIEVLTTEFVMDRQILEAGVNVESCSILLDYNHIALNYILDGEHKQIQVTKDQNVYGLSVYIDGEEITCERCNGIEELGDELTFDAFSRWFILSNISQ